MTDMWEALERYQPFAERHGFGAAWKRMTTERTPGAAGDAAAGAADAASLAIASWEAARAAAYAEAEAAWAAAEAEAAWAARAAAEAARAIRHINEAIAEEKL